MSTLIFQICIKHFIYECIFKAKSVEYCKNEQFPSASKAKLYHFPSFVRKFWHLFLSFKTGEPDPQSFRGGGGGVGSLAFPSELRL